VSVSSRDRDLRVLAAAIGVSAVGDFVAMIVLALRTSEMWSGPGVAVLFICLWSPVALLAGHVGILVDHIETRALAIVAVLFQGVIAAELAFASSVVVLLALTFVLGIGVAVGQAAEFALVPLLAGSRPVGRANGLVESTRGIGFMIGPLLGGLFADSIGVRASLLLDAATFVVIGAALASMPVRRPPQPAHAGRPRAREGVTLLFQERLLAIAVGVGAVSLIFMSASIPADFVFTQNVLGIRNIGFGAVLTVWAIGMVLASNTIPQRVPVHAIATVTLLAAAVQGIGKFLPPFWLVFPFMLCCYFVGGAGHGVKNAGFRTLIHQSVEPSRHGRAFAAYNGLRNTAELVALAGGGILVSTLGARGTLWLAGGVSALAGICGAVLLAPAQTAAAARANAS
jgi:MFS family permease